MVEKDTIIDEYLKIFLKPENYHSITWGELLKNIAFNRELKENKIMGRKQLKLHFKITDFIYETLTLYDENGLFDFIKEWEDEIGKESVGGKFKGKKYIKIGALETFLWEVNLRLPENIKTRDYFKTLRDGYIILDWKENGRQHMDELEEKIHEIAKDYGFEFKLLISDGLIPGNYKSLQLDYKYVGEITDVLNILSHLGYEYVTTIDKHRSGYHKKPDRIRILIQEIK